MIRAQGAAETASTASAPSATSTSALGCALSSLVSSTANSARMETRPLHFPRLRHCLHRHPPPGPGGGSAARLAASPSGQRGLGAPYYLGDPAALPPELAGATIVVQSRNGQSWITTVTTVLDRGSNQVTDSGPAVDTLISGSCPVE